jgi:hypothetical protein
MKMKKYLPMHLFNFLKETSFLNSKALFIEYPEGYNSFEILFEGSKNLPRKEKKKLRKMLID